MKMWRKEDFHLLLKEAIKCDMLLKNTQRFETDERNITKVFITTLMIQGKVRAAVRWLSEKSRGRVLHPAELVEVREKHGDVTQLSVCEVLVQKHPNSKISPKTALLMCDDLPSFENVEVTGVQVLCVATLIQGGAGQGGCDGNHWQVVILRYGAHCKGLHDSVACICHTLDNSFVP